MLRVNIFLGLIVVACAIGVIAAQHQARKFYAEFEREQDRMRQLDVEWGQLQLEQSTWAAHSRVEKIAREKLQMVPPPAGSVLVLEAQAKP